MPAATSIIAGTGLLVSTGLSIHKQQQAKKEARRARREIENYERQDLKNVYAGLALPVEQARIQRESIQQQAATTTEALSRAGARGLAQLPRVQQQQQQGMAQISAQLEESRFRLNQLIAQDEARIQGIKEQRDVANLQGLGQQYNVARQEQAAATQSIYNNIDQTAQLGIQVAGTGGKGTGGKEIDLSKSVALPQQAPVLTGTGQLYNPIAAGGHLPETKTF